MKLLTAFILCYSTIAFGQLAPKKEPFKTEPYAFAQNLTYMNSFGYTSGSQEQVRIYTPSNTDEKRLIEVKDKTGIVILTAYTDGHVVASDPTKIDEAAKEFWMLLAKYMNICETYEREKR